MSRDRSFDLVVFGATGFAGRLVAEYLAERYGDAELRWAIAGRDDERLRALVAQLEESFPGSGRTPHLVADSHDPGALAELAASTTVVATTVGPYAEHGEPLVEACLREGTDLVDLTGEPQFIRRTIDRHHDEAQRAGVRIVHCCGFDSVPSDLGTMLLQDEVIARDGEPCDEVRTFVTKIRGGISGGTAASMIRLVEDARDRRVRRILADPYSLNPDGAREGPDGRSPSGPVHDPVTGWWSGPFVMASVNTRIVRRSNALLGHRYGRTFRYGEAVKTGSGPWGALKAAGLAAGLGLFRVAIGVRPTRSLLRRFVLPAPGEGPDRRSIETGFFEMELSGRRDGRERARVTVRGRRDPGYGATACMLAESGLCLALDRAALSSPGGILTPASAMGRVLVDRLRRRDLEFEVALR